MSGTFSPHTRVIPCRKRAYQHPIPVYCLGDNRKCEACFPFRPFGRGVFRLAATDGWGIHIVRDEGKVRSDKQKPRWRPQEKIAASRLRGNDNTSLAMT